MGTEWISEEELQQAIKLLEDSTKRQEENERALLKLRISNAQRLATLQQQLEFNRLSYLERQEQEIQEKLVRKGYDARLVLLGNEQKIKERYQTALTKATSEEEKKSLRDRYQEELKLWKENKEEINKIEEANEEEKLKRHKKQANELYNLNKKQFDTLGNTLFSKKRWKEAVQELTDFYMSEAGGNMSEADAAKKAEETAKQNRRAAALDQAFNALAGFAKQLEGTMNDLGSAKSAIDTRLQGSNNTNIGGSYWELMNLHVTSRIGMSPFIKQSSVVENLKTLVGQGISFNVEQRAFLDTISDKIATTFEATDSTLLKLVRIQQADTTAARLGMESALTAFLNNMYETTEYMQSAADSIRASLYEAQALMGATEGAAFEYQVQKWMGSLYSVGFSNTEGLAGALGKLAAGDISAINNGGYGNLLLMAANRANLSIADILANGLDDSETNQLMQAMVEYLQQIYAETKNSKVVAQQYATVYGLTASDLKAAANLYGSTTTIAENTVNYGGMIQRLQDMAGSMFMRTSSGEMLTNIFDNLKFGIASNMAMNPITYITYTLAGMLDDTVGGIAIPSIMAMGTGFDLETTVADLMRVGSLGVGLLGSLGTLVGGLFNSGGMFNPLGAYGIGNNITTLTRGDGTGLSAITAGITTSNSGYAGQSDSSDISNKLIQDEQEKAGTEVEAQQDKSNEIKLSDVNSSVIQIYDLLTDITFGNKTLKVDMGDISAWTNALGGKY